MTVGKKLRFEVFKRDSFTCQYCGKSAPDVILHVDHIKPRSKGGSDDITNLVTSCQDCNLGKGARELSDDTVVAKQRDQLKLLQERREQLEMMMEWQRSLIDAENDAIDELAVLWIELTKGWELNDQAGNDLSKLLREFSFPEIVEAMRIATSTYLTLDSYGIPTKHSVEIAFKKVSGICYVKSIEGERPYMRDLFYIRGILKNRCYGYKLPGCIDLMCEAIDTGVAIATLRRIAKTVDYYEDFQEQVQNAINNVDGGQ